MNGALEANLLEKYSAMFTRKTSAAYSHLPFSLDVGDGWYNLIDTLCSLIQNHYENEKNYYEYQKKQIQHVNQEPRLVNVVQVKEKFGGLRFYVDGADDRVRGMIELAEAMSFHICEKCGGKGKVGGQGWISTLCDPCREALKASREK